MTYKNSLITENETDWLRKYIQNAAPSGNEESGQKMWLDYIKPYVDEHFVDNYGNVAAVINPGKKFKVVIEAHADEIAWYVNYITPEGFIRVEQTGGTDAGIAPSEHVFIHTAKGKVNAVFGWPATHVRDSGDEKPIQKKLFVDCGCKTSNAVKDLGIEVGDFVTYQSGFKVMNRDYFVGRALDNRMGGFIIARVARMIKENEIDLPYSLYMLNCVQEEVGTKGAEMMAHSVKPNCALVVDVTHETHSPMMDKNKEGNIELGKGPVVTKAAPVHTKMRHLLLDTAKENDIPYQLAVSAKSTGTDTDSFAYANGGIPSALISMPLRYMHTTVETVHRDDVENSIRLLYHALLKLTPDFNFKYF